MTLAQLLEEASWAQLALELDPALWQQQSLRYLALVWLHYPLEALVEPPAFPQQVVLTSA